MTNVHELRDIWGTGADAIWAGGNCDPGASAIRDAFVEHLRGGAWQDVTPPAAVGDHRGLQTIWASGEDDVWAASSAEISEGDVIPHHVALRRYDLDRVERSGDGRSHRHRRHRRQRRLGRRSSGKAPALRRHGVDANPVASFRAF
jgi:hypothetical protein